MILHSAWQDGSEALPHLFCWTRFGSESGESVEQILGRKELERRGNRGLFLWGIGNSVGGAVGELVRKCERPEVLFSPIKGPARAVDAAPTAVVRWTVGETVIGSPFSWPEHSLVTSRQTGRQSHYALVCFSEQPIGLADPAPILAFETLRNLLSGKPLGASQVTAVVSRHADQAAPGRRYPVALRTQLVAPFIIRLLRPELLRDGAAVRTAYDC